MQEAAKEILSSLEVVRESAIAFGLIAGWVLSSMCFSLVRWFHNSYKNRRVRIGGTVAILGLFGIVNLLIIAWA